MLLQKLWKNSQQNNEKNEKEEELWEDGISQDVILLGEKTLMAPITYLINTSITSGVFPDHWKKAVVIPILIVFIWSQHDGGNVEQRQWLSSLQNLWAKSKWKWAET